MQDKINTVTRNKANRHYTKKEDRRLHIEKWQESGLSMSEYCRQNNLPLSSFSTWSRTDSKPKAKFKPIVIASPQIREAAEPKNIIEIIMGQHIKLRFLNITETSLVIDIARRLSNAINH